MIIHYSDEEFTNAKSRDLLLLECEKCHTKFLKKKKDIKECLTHRKNASGDFCSRRCCVKAYLQRSGRDLHFSGLCKQCELPINRQRSWAKGKNVFCSSKCAGLFNNKNRTTGFNRSKLEIWLETELHSIFPNLTIIFNDRTQIGLELDIFIPKLNVAIELNGIIHYKPIYGIEQLIKVQDRDKRKIVECLSKNISLYILNTSNHRYFKTNSAKEFLDIITNIINKKLADN